MVLISSFPYTKAIVPVQAVDFFLEMGAVTEQPTEESIAAETAEVDADSEDSEEELNLVGKAGSLDSGDRRGAFTEKIEKIFYLNHEK